MELVNDYGSISTIKFRCLIKNEEYMVIGTNNDHNGESWHESVWKSTDIVKRLSDGLKKGYTREELKKRFAKIEVL